MTHEEILNLIDNKEFVKVKEALNALNRVDIAEIFDELDKANISLIFRMLSKDDAADVFAYLEPDTQKTLIESLTDKEVGAIINDLFIDDAVDFIEEMPAVVVGRVLKNADEETRRHINTFLQYGEDTAGSIMTNEFVDLKQNATCEEAIDIIRRKAVDKETIYTCYVKDDTRKLVGIVTVKQLLITPKQTPISDIMERNVIFAHTSDDREVLAAMFTKYGLLAIPVVDSEERIVGIVTIDDAITVIEEEATEDIEKMAALKPSEKPYLSTGVFKLAGNRITWLIALMFSALLTGMIINSYEQQISVLPVLVGFIPMLMSTGGNSGAQSSALIIRGMAVGDIQPRDIGRVLWKELRIALLIGIVLGGIVILRIFIFSSGENLQIGDAANELINLALAVSLTLLCTIVLAKLLGVVMPITAKSLNLDPAVMASPLITTMVDALSLLIYFGLLNVFIHGL